MNSVLYKDRPFEALSMTCLWLEDLLICTTISYLKCHFSCPTSLNLKYAKYNSCQKKTNGGGTVTSKGASTNDFFTKHWRKKIQKLCIKRKVEKDTLNFYSLRIGASPMAVRWNRPKLIHKKRKVCLIHEETLTFTNRMAI